MQLLDTQSFGINLLEIPEKWSLKSQLLRVKHECSEVQLSVQRPDFAPSAGMVLYGCHRKACEDPVCNSGTDELLLSCCKMCDSHC